LVFAASPLSAGCWFELRVAEFDLAASVQMPKMMLLASVGIWAVTSCRQIRASAQISLIRTPRTVGARWRDAGQNGGSARRP